MPGNAEVQFHRAEAEFALERFAAARASYDRALAAAAAGSPLPAAETARSRLAAIAALPAAAGAPGRRALKPQRAPAPDPMPEITE